MTRAETRFDCDAVLFDCDGVLVDSDASVIRGWSRWATALGFDPDAVLAVVHGRRSGDTVRELVAPDRQAEALALIDRFEVEDAAAVTAIPGAVSLVTSMPSDRWAVVTSGNTPLARARLSAAGVPIPSALVTADDVRHGKPDPEGYLAAAALLGVDPSRTVVLEDAASGVRAARAAGVAAVIGVGSRADLGAVDVRVRDLSVVAWTNSGLVVCS